MSPNRLLPMLAGIQDSVGIVVSSTVGAGSFTFRLLEHSSSFRFVKDSRKFRFLEDSTIVEFARGK